MSVMLRLRATYHPLLFLQSRTGISGIPPLYVQIVHPIVLRQSSPFLYLQVFRLVFVTSLHLNCQYFSWHAVFGESSVTCPSTLFAHRFCASDSALVRGGDSVFSRSAVESPGVCPFQRFYGSGGCFGYYSHYGREYSLD